MVARENILTARGKAERERLRGKAEREGVILCYCIKKDAECKCSSCATATTVPVLVMERNGIKLEFYSLEFYWLNSFNSRKILRT